mmetsp:Transcript_148360/g.210743  ORF Transcript_148360/g.210743 Transcript_148360/m.210743 type:complete len:184 (-) Transcript_148360:71-622(-)
MWHLFHAALYAFLAHGIRDDLQLHHASEITLTRGESHLQKDADLKSGSPEGHHKLAPSSLTEAEQNIVTATIRRLAMGQCQVEDAMTMKLQSLLQALRGCLDERKKMSADTRKLLKEEKEEGKIYASEVRGIMNLIRRVQNPAGMEKPWQEDHYDALAQLLEKTNEAEKAAEMVWQDNKTSVS